MKTSELLEIIDKELFSDIPPPFKGLMGVFKGQSSFSEWESEFKRVLDLLNVKYSIYDYLNIPKEDAWVDLALSNYNSVYSVREAIKFAIPTLLIKKQMPVQGELF